MKKLLFAALACAAVVLLSGILITACIVVSGHGVEFGFNNVDFAFVDRVDNGRFHVISNNLTAVRGQDGSCWKTDIA